MTRKQCVEVLREQGIENVEGVVVTPRQISKCHRKQSQLYQTIVRLSQSEAESDKRLAQIVSQVVGTFSL